MLRRHKRQRPCEQYDPCVINCSYLQKGLRYATRIEQYVDGLLTSTRLHKESKSATLSEEYEAWSINMNFSSFIRDQNPPVSTSGQRAGFGRNMI